MGNRGDMTKPLDLQERKYPRFKLRYPIHGKFYSGNAVAELDAVSRNVEKRVRVRLLDRDGLSRLSEDKFGSPKTTRVSQIVQISIFHTATMDFAGIVSGDFSR
jgi:hypothetical protein